MSRYPARLVLVLQCQNSKLNELVTVFEVLMLSCTLYCGNVCHEIVPFPYQFNYLAEL